MSMKWLVCYWPSMRPQEAGMMERASHGCNGWIWFGTHTQVMLNLLLETTILFISEHWDGANSWNISLWKTRPLFSSTADLVSGAYLMPSCLSFVCSSVRLKKTKITLYEEDKKEEASMRCSLLHGSWDQILRRCPSVNLFSNQIGSLSFHPIFPPIFGVNVHSNIAQNGNRNLIFCFWFFYGSLTTKKAKKVSKSF